MRARSNGLRPRVKCYMCDGSGRICAGCARPGECSCEAKVVLCARCRGKGIIRLCEADRRRLYAQLLRHRTRKTMFTPDVIQTILFLRSRGASVLTIARMYGVTKTPIFKILKGGKK